MDYTLMIEEYKSCIQGIDKVLKKYKSQFKDSTVNRQKLNGTIYCWESIRRELLGTINELESRLNR